MGDSSDDHQALVVVDGIHDPVVADSNPIIVAPGELDDSYRSGTVGQAIDRGRDTVAERAVETPIRARRLGVQADLVPVTAPCAYVRTSDQGTAESRSSRTWRAARLSSR